MRPEEMRAAIIEAVATELALLSCHPSKVTKNMVAGQYRRAHAALTAIESKLSEIGAKITVREPSEALCIVGAQSLSRASLDELGVLAVGSDHQVARHKMAMRWRAMHDAAPLTPWLKEDTHGEG